VRRGRYTARVLSDFRRGSFYYQVARGLWRAQWRRTYSQFGEDVVIQHLFPRKRSGVYVDVGCFHPRKYSNTYALYRRGWRGINVDISRLKVRLFRTLRPRDITVLAAATNEKRDVTVYRFGSMSLWDTIDEASAHAYCTRLGRAFTTDRIPGLPLSEIVAGTDITPESIDLLSIDVEGHDLAVLQGFDFARHLPKVVVVEHHAGRIEDVMSSEIYEFMADIGYQLTHWLMPSLVFQRADDVGPLKER
jgi:hypothetical protein